ncbi:hypothetical protein [Streptomyces sp. C10-9-1]|uniref:hypothetical protein n=1 Tax=Streptomyces sp. C10-9-1 TaxID=1859285 RepID=UPI003F49F0F6
MPETRRDISWVVKIRLHRTGCWLTWSEGHRAQDEALLAGEQVDRLDAVAEVRYERVTRQRDLFTAPELHAQATADARARAAGQPAPAPVGLHTLLEQEAARLPATDADTISLDLTVETLLSEERPLTQAHGLTAARLLLARHARELATDLIRQAGHHGQASYDYETGPGMHHAARRLLGYAASLDCRTPPAEEEASWT